MNCPNCGALLPNDKLICEKCGAILEIVAELDDVAFEEASNDSHDDGVKLEEEFDDFYHEFDMEFDEDPNIFTMLAGKHASGKGLYIAMAFVLLIFVFGAIFIGKKLNARNSYDYQIQVAKEKVNNNDILGAISSLENAYKIKPSADILFTIADYYYTLNRENDAIYSLLEIAHGDFKPTETESAFRKVITLYSEAKSYEKIAEILETCDNEVILSAYEDFLVFTPQFSFDGGTYDEAIELKLFTEGSGTIYYTMDSTVPNDMSNVFRNSISLSGGSYSVSAVYINKYGVSSEPVSNKYQIDIEYYFEPVILTDSGDYSEATLIEADLPVLYTLYYTTDGSDPDLSSKRYLAPIPMPEGESVFRFVSYASDGTKSGIVEKKYNLTLSFTYTLDDAIKALAHFLYDNNILYSGGKKPGYDGRFRYIYSATYPIQDYGTYYFYVEYHESESGVMTNTNTIYAVNVNDLSIYKVVTISNGNYTLTDPY